MESPIMQMQASAAHEGTLRNSAYFTDRKPDTQQYSCEEKCAKGNPMIIKLDRVDYWVSKGAKPTSTMHAMIKRARRAVPATRAKRGPSSGPACRSWRRRRPRLTGENY